MIKPTSLRNAITAAFPQLTSNPDKLLVFADAGTIVATSERTLSFEWRYTLNLILLDFTDDADAVMITLLDWVRVNEIDLVQSEETRQSGITFEVDHLNGATYDLSIKLKLTESVKVTKGANGKYMAEHLPEVTPDWMEPGGPLWTS